jgi:hypothetical protein
MGKAKGAIAIVVLMLVLGFNVSRSFMHGMQVQHQIMDFAKVFSASSSKAGQALETIGQLNQELAKDQTLITQPEWKDRAAKACQQLSEAATQYSTAKLPAAAPADLQDLDRTGKQLFPKLNEFAQQCTEAMKSDNAEQFADVELKEFKPIQDLMQTFQQQVEKVEKDYASK